MTQVGGPGSVQFRGQTITIADGGIASLSGSAVGVVNNSVFGSINARGSVSIGDGRVQINVADAASATVLTGLSKTSVTVSGARIERASRLEVIGDNNTIVDSRRVKVRGHNNRLERCKRVDARGHNTSLQACSHVLVRGHNTSFRECTDVTVHGHNTSGSGAKVQCVGVNCSVRDTARP